MDVKGFFDIAGYVLAFIGFVVYITITDYRPDIVEDLEISGSGESAYELEKDTFSLRS